MKKTQFKMILVGLAEYYKTVFTENQLEMYAHDLLVLSEIELLKAIEIYRANPENNFAPLPAKLVALIRPVENQLDIGRVVSGRIITAIGKFGHNNPKEARMFIGDLGWEVVKFQGGWTSICELTSDQIRDEQPRWRDLAQSLNKRAANGNLDEAPKLAINQNQTALKNLIGDTMKKLE